MLNPKTLLTKIVWQSACLVLLAAVLALASNHFRTNRLPLVGNWSPEARMATDSGQSLIISLDEAEKLYSAGQAVFLDARPAAWFEFGHIKGAANLPPDEIDQLLPQVLGQTPHDRTIITYCDGEDCELSHQLALSLMERGYTRVRVLVNGWTAWSEKGLPTAEDGS